MRISGTIDRRERKNYRRRSQEEAIPLRLSATTPQIDIQTEGDCDYLLNEIKHELTSLQSRLRNAMKRSTEVDFIFFSTLDDIDKKLGILEQILTNHPSFLTNFLD